MDEIIEMTSSVDEEENERKLLADTSDDEVEINEKVDEMEVLESDSGDVLDESKDSKDNEDEDSNSENDEQDEKEVYLLEKRLAQNSFDYEAHKLLIAKLHKMGELDRLRVARENMSSKYPLTPELWQLWLQDEMKLALTPEQKYVVTKICERAITDYLCKYIIIIIFKILFYSLILILK
jgi:hypothetical protein